jgi:hypothetical protein
MRDRLDLKRNKETYTFSSVRHSKLALLCATTTTLLVFNASAHASTTAGCGRMMGGSALLSEREYSAGEFEFKLLPSLAPGIVTVVGLANDGTQH